MTVETLEAKLQVILDLVRQLVERDDANRFAHMRLDQRLKNHEARLLTLERPRRR